MADVSKNVEIALKIVGANDKTLKSLVGAFENIQKAVNSTTASIDKFKTTLESIKVPAGMANVTTAFKELNGIKFSNLNQIATGFAKLKEIGTPHDLKPFATEMKKLQGITLPNLGQIGTGLEKIIKTPLSSFAMKIGTLDTNLRRLQGITLPNLGQIANGLEKLLKTPLSGLALKIGSLDSNLRRLDGLTLPNLGQIATGLEKIMKTPLSGFAAKITTLEAGLKRLSNINLDKLATVLKGLTAINLNKVANQLKQTEKAIRETGNTAQKSGLQIGTFAGKIKTVLQFRIITEALQHFKAALVSSISSIIDYDQALKDLQAITGATSLGVEQMGDMILEVASTTKFSATEVAEGMRIIGQAGFSAAESVQIMGDVADLATGTLSSMASTVDLVTTTMRVFRIDASESASIVDVFANAVNGSKLTVDKLRTAMNYVGPIARDAGVSFKELSASMMTLANSGLRASSIGTGLRRVFAELIDPSKKLSAAADRVGVSLRELDPRASSLSSVLSNLSLVVTDTQVAFDVFGKRGASAVLALTSEGSKFESLLENVSKTGTAAKQAAIQIEGLGVSLKNARDKIGVLAIKIGNAGLAGAIKTLIGSVANLTDVLIAFSDTALGKATIGLGLFAIALGIAAAAAATFAQAFLILKGSLIMAPIIKSLASAALFFETTIAGLFSAALFNPITGWVIAITVAIGLAIAAFIHLSDRAERAAKATAKLADEYQIVTKSLKDYSVKMATTVSGSKESTDANKALRISLFEVAEEYKDVATEALAAALSINPLTGEFIKGTEALDIYTAKLKEVTAQKLVDSADAANNAFKKLEIAQKDGFFSKFTGGVKVAGNSVEEMEKYVAGLDEKLGDLTESEKKSVEGLALMKETVNKLLVGMEKLGQLDLYDTEEEFISLAKSLGYTDEVLKLMIDQFNALKKGSNAKNIVQKWGEDALKGSDNIARAMKAIEDNGIKWDDGDEKIARKATADRKILVAEEAALFKAAKLEAKSADDKLAVWTKYQADYAFLQDRISKNIEDVAKNRTLQNGIALADEEQKLKDSLAKIAKLYENQPEKIAKETAKANAVYAAAITNANEGIAVDYQKQIVDYKSHLNERKTAYSKHLLELERERANGSIDKEQYNQALLEADLDFYEKSLQNATAHFARLNEATANPKDYQKRKEQQLKAEQDLQNFISKSISKNYDAQLAASEKLKALTIKEEEENLSHYQKLYDAKESFTSKKAGLDESYAAKREQIAADTFNKLKALDDKLIANKKSLELTLLGISGSAEDKIRAIRERGMTDAQKQNSEQAAAARKLSEGNKLIAEGEKENDTAKLASGVALIKQYESLVSSNKNVSAAISGVTKAQKILSAAATSKDRIKAWEIEQKKIKAVAAEAKKFASLKLGYEAQVKNATEAYAKISAKANINHNNNMANFLRERVAENEKTAQALANIQRLNPQQNNDKVIASIDKQNKALKDQIKDIDAAQDARLKSIGAVSAAEQRAGDNSRKSWEENNKQFIRTWDSVKGVWGPYVDASKQAHDEIEGHASEASQKIFDTLSSSSEQIWARAIDGAKEFTDAATYAGEDLVSMWKPFEDSAGKSFGTMAHAADVAFRDVKESFRTVQDAAADTGQTIKDGLSFEEIDSKINDFADNLDFSMTLADMTEQATKAMADAFDLDPLTVMTEQATKAMADAFENSLDPAVLADMAEQATKAMADAFGDADPIVIEPIIDPEDSVSGFKKALASISDTIINVLAYIPAEKVIDRFKDDWGALGDAAVKVLAYIPAEKVFDRFKDDLGGLKDIIIKIFTYIPALKLFDRFKDDWDELKDKKITLTVHTERTGASASSSSESSYAAGGRLPGFGGGDRRPALLEDGEWIINKFAVRKFGDSFMNSINNMSMPRFATGGKVGVPSVGATKKSSIDSLSNFGKVSIDTGKVKFPALVHQDVVTELKSHLRKMNLMGANV